MHEQIRDDLILSDKFVTARLVEAFQAIRDALPPAPSRPVQQFYKIAKIETALAAIGKAVSVIKEQGGIINPWAIAGIKDYEVRNSAALAGLWLADFGGDCSKRFLAAYLSSAVDTIEWADELAHGYSVETEVDPAGEGVDRVDLVVQTQSYLIGIEVKINAGLGREQLERYSSSLTQRAQLLNLQPIVILLAPFKSHLPSIKSTHWSNVSAAAAMAAGRQIKERSFAQQLIASFGEYVSKF